MNDDETVPPPEKDALAQRLDRFIKGLERAKRPANRRESHHLVAALTFLQHGHYEAGQAAMSNAERMAPLPPETANQLETNEPLPVPQLRDALQRILAGER
jgi:hypothetical protein